MRARCGTNPGTLPAMTAASPVSRPGWLLGEVATAGRENLQRQLQAPASQRRDRT